MLYTNACKITSLPLPTSLSTGFTTSLPYAYKRTLLLCFRDVDSDIFILQQVFISQTKNTASYIYIIHTFTALIPAISPMHTIPNESKNISLVVDDSSIWECEIKFLLVLLYTRNMYRKH